jgi:hypothetical protein
MVKGSGNILDAPGEKMLRLIRIAFIACLLMAASCREETATVARSAEPAAPPIVESTVPAATGTYADPIIEPLPSPIEVPSILRRDPTTTTAQQESNVVTDTHPPRITSKELKDLLDQGRAVVVDVRAAEYFQQRHIPGSLNIPLSETVLRANELPEGKTVVTICT